MPPALRNLLVYWLPIGLYVGLIFLASSLSSFPVRLPALPHFDKLLHLLEYAVLAVLVTRAVHSLHRPRAAWLVLLLSLALVLACAGLDELYQASVPKRSSDVYDLLADGLGGLLGSGLTLLWLRRRRAQALEPAA